MELNAMKSWNEIRKAATAFSKRWKNAYDEKSQAQSFLKEFFAMFGVDTVVFNAFEHRVKFTDGSQGYAVSRWMCWRNSTRTTPSSSSTSRSCARSACRSSTASRSSSSPPKSPRSRCGSWTTSATWKSPTASDSTSPASRSRTRRTSSARTRSRWTGEVY